MNHETNRPFETDEEAKGLYAQDGRVIISAVAAYLEAQGAGQESPLDPYTNSVHTYSVDTLQESINKSEEDPLSLLGRPGSIDYAVNTYFSYEIGRSLHRGRTPVSAGFTGNPDYSPDLQTETKRVLEHICDEQPGIFSFLEKTKEDIAPWSAPVEGLRILGGVVVAGLQEAKNIYNTLEQYAQQDMSPDEFEVFVNVNVPAKENSEDGSSAEILAGTLAEIARFKHTYPAITVRNFGTRYVGDKPSISSIRADLFNVIGLDMLLRGRIVDIPVVSNDADTVELSPHYLSDISARSEDQGADIITGRLLWQPIPGLPDEAPANKLLAFESRLSQEFNDYALRSGNFHILTSDANTAISLATYFAVGGFTRGLELAEMHKLVSKIRVNREGASRPVETCATEAYLTTNSRRLIEVMALGHPPTKAWDQDILIFGHDDELRTARQRVAEANNNAAQNFEPWLAEISKAYLGRLPAEDAREIIQRNRLALQI